MSHEIDPIKQPFDYLWKLPDWEYQSIRGSHTTYTNGFMSQKTFLGLEWNFKIRRLVITIFGEQDRIPTEIYLLTDLNEFEAIKHPPLNRPKALELPNIQAPEVTSFISRQLQLK